MAGDPDANATIIVGFDGSATSWSALWWACGEAQRLGGRVIAAYVTCTTEATLGTASLAAGFDAGTYANAAQAIQVEKATELQAEMTLELGVKIDFRHLHGDTAEQLMRLAEHTHADLIAVGPLNQASPPTRRLTRPTPHPQQASTYRRHRPLRGPEIQIPAERSSCRPFRLAGGP